MAQCPGAQKAQIRALKWQTPPLILAPPFFSRIEFWSELDRLASPDRADQYLAPAPIRAPGLCHPTCPNRAN